MTTPLPSVIALHLLSSLLPTPPTAPHLLRPWKELRLNSSCSRAKSPSTTLRSPGYLQSIKQTLASFEPRSSDSVRFLTPSSFHPAVLVCCLPSGGFPSLGGFLCLRCRNKSCHFDPSSMWARQALHIYQNGQKASISPEAAALCPRPVASSHCDRR